MVQMNFLLGYNETIDANGNETRILSPEVRWQMTRAMLLTLAFDYGTLESDTLIRDVKTFRANFQDALLIGRPWRRRDFMTRQANSSKQVFVSLLLIVLVGCAGDDVFFEPNMDFGSVQSVAVLPFQNLTSADEAAERVRDTFMGMLLATGALYVLPPGEVARGHVEAPQISTGRSVRRTGQAAEHDSRSGCHIHRRGEGIWNSEIRYDLCKCDLGECRYVRDHRRPGGMVGVIHEGRHRHTGSPLRRRRSPHEYRHGAGRR